MSRSARMQERVHKRNIEVGRLEREVVRLNDIVNRQKIMLLKAENLARDFLALCDGKGLSGTVEVDATPVMDTSMLAGVDTLANSEELERETQGVEK